MPDGTPIICEITANGSGKASASTRSTDPASAIRSSISSTRRSISGCSAATERGVNAFDTSLRSRVWSGGSWSSIESPPDRSSRSP